MTAPTIDDLPRPVAARLAAAATLTPTQADRLDAAYGLTPDRPTLLTAIRTAWTVWALYRAIRAALRLAVAAGHSTIADAAYRVADPLLHGRTATRLALAAAVTADLTGGDLPARLRDRLAGPWDATLGAPA